MLCEKPVLAKGMYFPCGQCMPCRLYRRRVWTHRIMLEASMRADNAFGTLTYSNENLPRYISVDGESTTISRPTLVKKDVQNWLKRFRKAIDPLRVRFYAVGEYGDETHRPHYHIAIFGYPTCRYGRSRYGSGQRQNCCPQCDLVRDTWGFGQVDLGTLEIHSAQYIAGYVTKKMTAKADPRLEGRYPEFGEMSRRPGIGVDMLHDVASTFMEFNLDQSQDDVPSSLRLGSRNMPLGNFMRRKLRTFVGMEENAPESTLKKMEEELRPLQEAARNSKTVPSVRDQITNQSKQKRRNQASRSKVFTKGKKL